MSETSKYRREKNIARLYKLTLTEAHAIIEYQQSRCPLCLRPLGEAWVVDHDHSIRDKRRSVRGITHNACNSKLQWLEANPHLISRHVASYLQFPPAQVILERSEYVSPWKRSPRYEIRLVDGVRQKWCREHKVYHPLDRFGRKASHYSGYHPSCKDYVNGTRRRGERA